MSESGEFFEIDKDKLIDAITKLNDWLCQCGIPAPYCVAAMKHLVALEEERSGMMVEIIDVPEKGKMQ